MLQSVPMCGAKFLLSFIMNIVFSAFSYISRFTACRKNKVILISRMIFLLNNMLLFVLV